MDKPVMQFNEEGLQEARLLIESLRSSKSKTKGSQGTPVTEEQINELKSLAANEAYVEELTEQILIDPEHVFADRLEMGEYLSTKISGQDKEYNTGLWTWISFVYIDQLLATNKDGLYLLGSEYRYIPDESRLRYYRHLARTAWKIYSHYGERAKLFLSIPTYTHSDFVEQSQKADVISNMNIIDLCLSVFYDNDKKKLKKGIANKVNVPGSFRRLVSVVSRQLYMNFDLYEMNSEKIIGILPDEFDKWKNI